ncbi:MAG TPA: hypothetical protein VLA02_11755 [Reyranella sp.]|nr:hypothetical protein [Reyranella sp.]
MLLLVSTVVPQLLWLSAYGVGAGASMAAASHAIMTHASAEHAGIAASIEEVAIELGGAIGIPVLGSILAGVYTAVLVLPAGAAVPSAAGDGIDQALQVARTLPAGVAGLLTGRSIGPSTSPISPRSPSLPHCWSPWAPLPCEGARPHTLGDF